MKRRAVLDTISWAQDEFGSLITNSYCTRRDVMRCVRAGLAESVGIVEVYDDFDNRTNRTREGFRLTAAGCAHVRMP